MLATFGERIYNEGIEKGIAKGREEGREEGIEKGTRRRYRKGAHRSRKKYALRWARCGAGSQVHRFHPGGRKATKQLNTKKKVFRL